MTQSLNIVASCTHRKTRSVPSKLLLRNVGKKRSLNCAVAQWWQRLTDSSEAPITARALYCGDYWSTILRLEEKALDYVCHTWIASAGYGLLHIDTPIRPYGATFSNGQADSVNRFATAELHGRELRAAWWRELSRYRMPSSNHARTLAELANRNREGWFLVVAGPLYLTAMMEDLLRARAVLKYPERLIIVSSANATLQSAFPDHLIPSTAKLQRRVGGSCSSLHARVAEDILKHANVQSLNAGTLKRRYESLLRDLPPSKAISREPISDDEVRDFITQHLRKKPLRSRTSLLSELRDSRKACEQGRFKRLFQEVTQRDIHAS